MKFLQNKLSDISLEKILWILTIVISVVATCYFYFHGQQNLADYDAIARLNIARKIIDSLTPGVGQLGGVWLPFPSILFIPFIWNDFLWHSGLAGSIISGIVFIVGAIFLYKTALLLTKNNSVSLFVWFMFVSNVNILLLQSMAMSESFFLSTLILTIYFLTKWTQTKDNADFLLAALSVMAITLARYEGYFVFIGAVVVVGIQCVIDYWRKEGRAKVEGMILFFLSVAAFGIFLWCLYCTLFYKDPLYWLHLYSGPKGQITTGDGTVIKTKQVTNTLWSSFVTYSEAALWTNGIITTILGIVGYSSLFISITKKLQEKKSLSLYLPIGIMSTILFAFLVYGYQRGFIPTIEYPAITLQHVLSKTFNLYSHSNIRYGIIMAPFLLLFIGIAAAKNIMLRGIIMLLFAFQLFTNFFTPLFLQFSFPVSWQYSIVEPVPWFVSHYDSGLILISANRHENFMFQTNLPYNDFIYEGSRNYWTTSLNDPSTYATWVVLNDQISGDTVKSFSTEHGRYILAKKFNLLYDKNGFKIYKIKQ